MIYRQQQKLSDHGDDPRLLTEPQLGNYLYRYDTVMGERQYLYIGARQEAEGSLYYMHYQRACRSAEAGLYIRYVNGILCFLHYTGYHKVGDLRKELPHWDVGIGDEVLTTRYSFNAAHNFLEQSLWLTEPEDEDE